MKKEVKAKKKPTPPSKEYNEKMQMILDSVAKYCSNKKFCKML